MGYTDSAEKRFKRWRHQQDFTTWARLALHVGEDPDGVTQTGREQRSDKQRKVNGIRTKTLLDKCDVAVVRFGDKYKQCNVAFDAGYCAASGKPYITLHDEDIVHPLKGVDASAMAWAKTTSQVVEILAYVISAR